MIAEDSNALSRRTDYDAGRAAIPYGYTLVIWSSGSVVAERQAARTWDIAWFFAGASAAYALLRLVVCGEDVHLERWASRDHIVAMRAVQGSAVEVTVATAAAAARLAAFWPWFIAPFTATITPCGVAISEAHVIPNSECRREGSSAGATELQARSGRLRKRHGDNR